ncbi:MAG: HlyD family efflux transporter periplasmic adaptor subunit [Gemmataceae bacterium]|nr:HlyD family efflux transporter periplasmic adaptor subunit [Gemmataceae bacterium]MDW8267242.1 HlyD family efflux transporter periplasmic adaptor subunit [Gemmataceae bacterium]
MRYTLASTASLGLLAVVLAGCNSPASPAVAASDKTAPTDEEATTRSLHERETGAPLYQVEAPKLPDADGHAKPDEILPDPVVLHNSRVTIYEKREVPSQREGVVLCIGRELEPGETPESIPADRLIQVKIGGEPKYFYRLKEGDRVKQGQLLAQLDNRLALGEYTKRVCERTKAESESRATELTKEEAYQRYLTIDKLRGQGKGRAPDEEVRGAWLTWKRYESETESKREAVKQAESEMKQALTVLDMHQIRSPIDGTIKTIYKKSGEALKAMEPIFHVQNDDRLRIEGLMELQHLARVSAHPDRCRVVVEASYPTSPFLTLTGHMQEVNGVAVRQGGKDVLVVSASEDGTVGVWSKASAGLVKLLRHPGPVKAVACTPPSAKASWCVSGAGDGKVRVWELEPLRDEPLRVLAGTHEGAVTCVAISPDGEWVASGGEDRSIIISRLSSGEEKFRVKGAHSGAITSIQFTPISGLVTAGRDNRLRTWKLGEAGARLELSIDRRSGDVTTLGVSPDGKRMLFDQGKELRVLGLENGLTQATLQSPAGAASFTTLALFSPDAQLILTAGGAEHRLQLWRTPTRRTRGYEVRQLVAADHSVPTCAAFAPDGSFIVSGTRDHKVLLWSVPAKEEIERQLVAQITRIDRSVDSGQRHVSIWAEVDNRDGRLVPGTTVTMAIYPPGN